MANNESRWFTSGFTYAGHPVACAAALENLRIIRDEHLLENAASVGTYFEERLASLQDLPLVGNVRGRKLMMCVEVVGDKTTKKTLPDELRDSKRIADACEARGLIVRPIGHLNVMSPPLVITRDQVDFIVETLGAAIREVADGLVREGVRIG
jgi:adenosylmethionine-8-amino-7-oxononanoate aminotransferase